MKPNVFITIPEGPLKSHMFTPAWEEELESFAQVEWNCLGREMTSEELAEAVPGKDALFTGWGSPKITAEVLDRGDRLKFIGHTAGTVRWLVEESFYSRGITLTNANLSLAPSVAEYCLMTLLMARWRLTDTLDRVNKGLWQDNNDVVPGINGCSIGLIGYGAITEQFIRLLRFFDVKIKVHSGHCSQDKAKALGFSLCSFDEALACDVVSLHMTLTPETKGIIGREQLRKIHDGAVLMNTSRGALIDQEALLEELQNQRFYAVLDVFVPEPLPKEHPLRYLKNAIVTPHSAGTSVYWRREMARLVLEDYRGFLRGEVPKGIITLEKYRTMTPM